MRRFGLAAAVLLALALHGGGALAQGRGQQPSPVQAAITRAVLPAPVSTEHTIVLPGRTLHFTATAGGVPLLGDRGQVQAEISVIAYQLDGADPRTRPVAFVVNGGPGFASAWLQLGALGPWRLPMAGPADAPSATPAVQPNAETWLDFTDLVFIDPAGTGYSRIDATAKDVRQHLWSVDGDIDSLSQAIGKWLDRKGRMLSPKYIVGESYGGFRAPRLVRALARSEGVGIAGLVLISPALDLSGGQAFDPLFWAERLPTEVAIARAARGPVTRAALADAEAYAGGDYLVDLVRGLSDPAAVARVSQRVAELTGLDPALVRRHGGRIDTSTFQREIDRARGRVASRFDGTVTMPDPFGSASFSRFPDPLLDGLEAPFSAAMMALYANRLHWQPEARYRLFNEQANRQWDFGRGARPQSMTALRTALALDPRFQVLVAAGLFDLVVPYFRTQMLLHTIPQAAGGDRVRFVVMAAGHMVYARDDSRVALRQQAEHMIEGQ